MNTDFDELRGALLDLTGLFNSPNQDALLLEKAGVSLDRALFPILSRVGSKGTPTIDELAELAGRDQSTVSRQVTRLEQMGLVTRQVAADDHRRREVVTTEQGRRVLQRIGRARNEILQTVLRDWTDKEQQDLVRSMRHFVASIRASAKERAGQAM